MNIYSGKMYHLKIKTNRTYEVLIRVTQIFVALNSHDDEILQFELLASTANVGSWNEMFIPLFYRSSPVLVEPKNLPLYINWPYCTPQLYEALKEGV